MRDPSDPSSSRKDRWQQIHSPHAILASDQTSAKPLHLFKINNPITDQSFWDGMAMQ